MSRGWVPRGNILSKNAAAVLDEIAFSASVNKIQAEKRLRPLVFPFGGKVLAWKAKGNDGKRERTAKKGKFPIKKAVHSLDIFRRRVYNEAQYVTAWLRRGWTRWPVKELHCAGPAVRIKNEVKKWHKLSLAAFIPMI